VDSDYLFGKCSTFGETSIGCFAPSISTEGSFLSAIFSLTPNIQRELGNRPYEDHQRESRNGGKAECQRATAVVDALSIREGLNKDQLDYLELVGDLVNEYEKHHVAQPENSSPVEVLRYLMEENRISTRQMSRILGKDESIVSKILKGERSITIEHARKFGHHFGVNPGLFLRLSDEMTVDFRRCLPLACRKHANQKW